MKRVNKIIAFLLIIAVPFLCYFLISSLSKKNVIFPRKFFFDTVIQNPNGSNDTVWHILKDFSLKNQFNDTVHLRSLKGKVVVLSSFFTSCPSICPTLTRNMHKLQESIVWKDKTKNIKKESAPVHFISISIDPERDDPSALLKYANTYGANGDVWWFLTGDKSTVYHYLIDEIKLGTIDGMGVDSNFIHSSEFVLIDRLQRIRGYYNGLDSADIQRISKDIGLLILEKN